MLNFHLQKNVVGCSFTSSLSYLIIIFYLYREVNQAVEKCQELHRQWQRIISAELPTTHYDYDKICKDLQNNIRNVEWDLEDLEETINILFLMYLQYVRSGLTKQACKSF